jgi:hypothetical protein
MNTVSEPLVALGRFSSSIEAQLAKARLELAGIPSVVSNELSMGEVELRVARSAVKDALAILEGGHDTGAVPADESQGVDEARCMICRASFLVAEEGPILWRLLRSLVLQIVPLPREWFESRRVRCGVCGYRWKQERTERPVRARDRRA